MFSRKKKSIKFFSDSDFYFRVTALPGYRTLCNPGLEVDKGLWQVSGRLLREVVAVEYPSSGKLKRRTQQFLLNFLRRQFTEEPPSNPLKYVKTCALLAFTMALIRVSFFTINNRSVLFTINNQSVLFHYKYQNSLNKLNECLFHYQSWSLIRVSFITCLGNLLNFGILGWLR